MRFLLLSFIFLGNYALAEYRVALIIENKKYPKYPLSYTNSNIESELKKDGFKVTVWKDIQRKNFEKKIEEFASVTPINSSLLIYYSGYLLSADHKGLRKNYLIPVDAELKKNEDITRRGILLENLFKPLTKRCGSRDKIIYLDIVNKYPVESFTKPTPFIKQDSPKSIFVFSNTKASEISESYSSSLSLYKYSDQDTVLNKLKKISQWTQNSEIPNRDFLPSKSLLPSDQLAPGKKAGDEWVNSIGMVFCWCPPGKYTMGSPKSMPGHEEDQVLKEVTFSKGFWISKYELTNLNYFKIRKREQTLFKENLPNHPLICQYDDKKHWVSYLKEKSPVPKGWSYDVPSEEQWEYAARAGSKEKYFWGSNEPQLKDYANFADKSLFNQKDKFHNYADSKIDDGFPFIAEVGQLKANPWGLHDVYGNVWEWCKTQYTTDRSAATKKDKRGQVVKGGSWCSQKEYCHSAFRNAFEGRFESNFLGLRLIIRQN